MQKAIDLVFNGKTLRGMEHIPQAVAGQKVPACILYHGFTGNKLEKHRMFLKIGRALEQAGVAVFRFDFLGSGESDGDFEDTTVSGQVAEAHAILESVRQDPRIDPARISLLGMSMGGTVASIIAGERPQDVEKLVLLSAAGELYDIELMQQIIDITLANPEARTVDVAGDLIGRLFGEDVKTLQTYERARNYAGDVLLIHGTLDPTVPCQVAHTYQERCYGERATVRLIEGADHTYNKFEWEQEVIDSVREFLKP